MANRSGSRDVLARIREDDGPSAVFVGLLVVASLSLGYAGGNVLAGESVGSQLWLVPVLAATLASMIALSERDSEA